MSRKHILIMLACCLIPLAALGAILIFKVPVNNVIYLGLVLLCPALHLLMMGQMMKHGHTLSGANGVGGAQGGDQAEPHAHGPAMLTQTPSLPNRAKQD